MSNQESPSNSVAAAVLGATGQTTPDAPTTPAGPAETKTEEQPFTDFKIAKTDDEFDLNTLSVDAFREDKPKPKEEPEEEKAEEEPEKEEEVAEVEEVEEEDGQEETEQKSGSRDYSDIPDEDQALFKQMSNDSFNKLKPIYLEHKTQGQKLQDTVAALESAKKEQLDAHPSYYTHPQGFVLTKSYQELALQNNVAAQLADHWTQQLVNIRRGEDWKSVDLDKDGKLIVGSSQAADAAAEAQVMRSATQSQQQSARINVQMDEYIKQHGTKQEAAIKILKEREEEFFPGYDKEDHPTKKTQADIISALPAEVTTGNPLASLLAKSGSAILILDQQVKQLRKDIAAAKGNKKDAKKATPTAKKVKSGGSKAVGMGVTMSDFAAARGRE